MLTLWHARFAQAAAGAGEDSTEPLIQETSAFISDVANLVKYGSKPFSGILK